MGDIPTVICSILTPSSRCAFAASSASLPSRTFLPHKVFMKVVRPVLTQYVFICYRPSEHIPVPDAPQTIKQNCMPFLTFFFLRIYKAEVSDKYMASSDRRIIPTMLLAFAEAGQGLYVLLSLGEKGSVIAYCAHCRGHDDSDSVS